MPEKLEEFIKVSLNGTGFICEPQELSMALDQDCDGNKYKVEKVYITREEYDSLKEFQGF